MSVQLDNSNSVLLQSPLFKKQYQKMERNLRFAREKGNSRSVEIWQNKIKDLREDASTINQEQQQVILNKKNKLSTRLKRLWTKPGIAYRFIVHPAIRNDDKVLRKMESIDDKKLTKYCVIELCKENNDVLDFFKNETSQKIILERLKQDGTTLSENELNLLAKHLSEINQSLSSSLSQDGENDVDPQNAEQITKDAQKRLQQMKNELMARYNVSKKDLKKKHSSSVFKAVSKAITHQHVNNLIDDKRALRFNFYNSKAEQLDAVVISPSSSPETIELHNKKTIIFVPGNLDTWESVVRKAQEMADHYGANVALYNGPGVLYSMGHERHTDDAVDAFQSFYRTMAEKVGDPKALVVVGHSLGGGISACGLEQIVKENPQQAPSLLVNLHSFSSLARAGASGVGIKLGAGCTRSNILKKIIKFLITINHVGTLNAAKAASRQKLADKVLIIHSLDDHIIRGKAQFKYRVDKYLQKQKSENDNTANEYMNHEVKNKIDDSQSPQNTSKRRDIHNKSEVLFDDAIRDQIQWSAGEAYARQQKQQEHVYDTGKILDIVKEILERNF